MTEPKQEYPKGIHIITHPQLREIRKNHKVRNRQVYFVDRFTHPFKHHPYKYEEYEDIKRRISRDEPKKSELALQAVNWVRSIRHKWLNDADALAMLKNLSARSSREAVFLIDEDEFPNAYIIRDICARMRGNGVNGWI
jgi:hypothetical protein